MLVNIAYVLKKLWISPLDGSDCGGGGRANCVVSIATDSIFVFGIDLVWFRFGGVDGWVRMYVCVYDVCV